METLSCLQPVTREHHHHTIPLHWCRTQSAPLHWCCDERPHSGTALYMEWISAQLPIQRLPIVHSSHQPRNPQKMDNVPYIAFA